LTMRLGKTKLTQIEPSLVNGLTRDPCLMFQLQKSSASLRVVICTNRVHKLTYFVWKQVPPVESEWSSQLNWLTFSEAVICFPLPSTTQCVVLILSAVKHVLSMCVLIYHSSSCFPRVALSLCYDRSVIFPCLYYYIRSVATVSLCNGG
jgi:hypothetical protein